MHVASGGSYGLAAGQGVNPKELLLPLRGGSFHGSLLATKAKRSNAALSANLSLPEVFSRRRALPRRLRLNSDRRKDRFRTSTPNLLPVQADASLEQGPICSAFTAQIGLCC